MKCLVAGGAGFIGSHLCDHLLSLGYEVDALDSFVTGRKENIAHINSSQFELITADLVEGFEPKKNYDAIYNLASPASPIDFSKMPVFILKTSAIGHERLLRIATDMKAKVLLASTSEVYGDPLVHPQVESYWGNVNPVGPRGCYDEAKRFAEAMSMAYFRAHQTQTRIVRIFNTYGPRMRPEDGRIIPNFFMQALNKEALTIYGDGSQTRSFCYVADMVKGLRALMESSVTSPVNIGNPTEKTVVEIADEVNRLTGNQQGHRFMPLPTDDPKRRCPNIDKAKKELNWGPQVSLAEGLGHTLEYFKSLC